LLICAFTAYMFGNATTSFDIYLWGCLMSFSNLGAWGVLYTYSAELYPTEARSTGVGLAAAFGRVGGILAPLVVGALFTGPDKMSLIFMMFTTILVVVAINMIVLGDETKLKALD